MNIYVANIDFKASESDLRKAFEQYGTVESVKIVLEKEPSATGARRSRGFGFVIMPDAQEADNALASLNGARFMSRDLAVNEARPQPASR